MKSWTFASFLLVLQGNPSGAPNCGLTSQSPCSKCCENRLTYVDLRTKPQINVLNNASGITVIEGPDEQPNIDEDCSKMALFKAGGDDGTQQNDAEAQGKFPNIDVWYSDKCNSEKLKASTNAIGSTVYDVTIYVSNNRIRFDNYQGLDTSLCHDECLFALNGQSDSQGLINEDVYLSLNRVIQGTPNRRGIGVCTATLYWTSDTCQEDD